jgi:(p)ppGpp synthase/HD superfamily hydrolase
MNYAAIARALDFAKVAHEGQKRKYSGDPYFFHCIDVLKILQENVPDASDEVFMAAVLHDTLEDTSATYEQLVTEFGEEVANLVVELTTVEVEGNRAARKEAEAKRLGGVSTDAQTIKYADIIANLSDIEANDPSFSKVYKREKQRALTLMTKGHEALRQQAWLLTLDGGSRRHYADFTGVSADEAAKMVGG